MAGAPAFRAFCGGWGCSPRSIERWLPQPFVVFAGWEARIPISFPSPSQCSRSCAPSHNLRINSPAGSTLASPALCPAHACMR